MNSEQDHDDALDRLQEQVISCIASNLEQLLREATAGSPAMTREQVASQAGMSRANLYDLLSGKNRQPSVVRLMKLARVLGVDLGRLIGEPSVGPGSRRQVSAVPDLRLWEPGISNDELAMLESIEWVGSAPTSPDRWLFVLSALRSSAAIDRRIRLDQPLGIRAIRELLTGNRHLRETLLTSGRESFLEDDGIMIPEHQWLEMETLSRGLLEELVGTRSGPSERHWVSRNETFSLVHHALRRDDPWLFRIALQLCAIWAHQAHRGAVVGHVAKEDEGADVEWLSLRTAVAEALAIPGTLGASLANVSRVLSSIKPSRRPWRQPPLVAASLLYFARYDHQVPREMPGRPLIYSRVAHENLLLIGRMPTTTGRPRRLDAAGRDYSTYVECISKLAVELDHEPDQLQRALEEISPRRVMQFREAGYGAER
jgi:transcriptional regulator with XRE-family HTH domain